MLFLKQQRKRLALKEKEEAYFIHIAVTYDTDKNNDRATALCFTFFPKNTV